MNRKAVVRGAVAILVFLNLGNAVAIYAMAVMELEFALGVVPLFDLDGEANLPTLFSGMLLYFAAVLALMISRWSAVNAPHMKGGWIAAGLVLLFLGTDELAGIHEAIDFVLMDRLETDGALAWPWVIPYGVLTVGVGLYFLKFGLDLGASYRRWLIIAGGLYAGSAIGFEMLGAIHAPAEGETLNFSYALLYTLEENGEMLGGLLAGLTFMRYLSDECRGYGAVVRVVSGSR